MRRNEIVGSKCDLELSALNLRPSNPRSFFDGWKEKDRAMRRSGSKQSFAITEELRPSLPCSQRVPRFHPGESTFPRKLDFTHFHRAIQNFPVNILVASRCIRDFHAKTFFTRIAVPPVQSQHFLRTNLLFFG